ncbi:MAG: YczE/YyaS/YitT family protein [Christensenellales bacterium]|jgi:uncharacterized membrane protein YczE
MNKKKFSSELALVLGLLLNSLAVAFMAQSDFGVSSLTSFPLALSYLLPRLSFGMWSFLWQVLAIAMLIIMTRSFRWGYLISFFIGSIFGYLLDLFTPLLSHLPQMLPLRILYYVIGMLILSIGISLLLRCRLPILPFETFIRGVSSHFNWPVKWIKTIYDCTSVLLALLTSLLFGRLVGVGIGTIASALMQGTLIQRNFRFLDSRFTFEATVPQIGRFIEMEEREKSA